MFLENPDIEVAECPANASDCRPQMEMAADKYLKAAENEQRTAKLLEFAAQVRIQAAKQCERSAVDAENAAASCKLAARYQAHAAHVHLANARGHGAAVTRNAKPPTYSAKDSQPL